MNAFLLSAELPETGSEGKWRFQLLALTFIGALVLSDFVRCIRCPTVKRVLLVRLSVWIAAGVAIAWPDAVTAFARAIGIGRGADVVLYIFVLAFLVTSYYWYARHHQFQRQLTEVMRHLTMREAEHGRVQAPGD
jgi:hypothetical protein